MMRSTRICTAALLTCAVAGAAHAATIAVGDATADLGPNLFLDETVSGGGDTTVSNGSFTLSRKDLSTNGPLNVGAGGTEVSITGIAWFGPNFAGTSATGAEVTVVYLGLDGVGGGGDDVVLGTTSAAYTFSGAGEYVWQFDAPITGTVDGLNSFFRFDMTATNVGGAFRMKNQAPFGNKMTVAGTSTAVPEPGSLALVALGGVLVAVRRRRG